jgi:hypothetical protein
MEEIITAPVYKTEINGRGNPFHWPHDTPLPAKAGTNFTKQLLTHFRYYSLTD